MVLLFLKKRVPVVPIVFMLLEASCGRVSTSQVLEEPEIYPDYKGVTLPQNIAPINFSWLGDNGSEGVDGTVSFDVPCRLNVRSGEREWQIRGSKGLFRFPRRMWRKIVSSDEIEFTVLAFKNGEWMEYAPFKMYVSQSLIDPWLSYRLIPPGYQTWNFNMGIYQRNLENYEETPIYEGRHTNFSCINCHSYCKGNPERMLFHNRFFFGGTLMVYDGTVEKLNTKTDSTRGPFVYPCWHPSGKYVAFSTNETILTYFRTNPERLEVYDKESDIVVYNVASRKVLWSPLTKSPTRFETFPTFSPDGRWLYFCSAEAVENLPEDYAKVKYALMRISFNPEDGSFGDRLETVFNAPTIGKSVSFPRISPDGRWLAFTLHKYGNFSIWHKDADIWMLDLKTGEAHRAEALNSDESESYHCWSSSGRWLVFSSRRDDGLYTRPYIAYVDTNGVTCKPFMLPQKNPKEYYDNLMYSYNIPELMTSPVAVPARSMAKVLKETPGTDVGL